MDKLKLLNFVNKYSLNGLCNSVKWTSKSRGLITSFITTDRSIFGTVAVKGVNFPDGVYGIYNTKGLIKILGILQNEIEMEVDNTTLTFKDDGVSAKFMLANISIIDDVPNPSFPEFDFSFDINSIFIDRFLKARAALEDAITFAFVTVDGKLSIVLNYAEHNTDRIVIPLDVDYDLNEPLLFNSDNFKEMLVANKDLLSGKVSVSANGVLSAKFQGDDVVASYYQVMLKQD